MDSWWNLAIYTLFSLHDNVHLKRLQIGGSDDKMFYKCVKSQCERESSNLERGTFEHHCESNPLNGEMQFSELLQSLNKDMKFV